MRFEVAAGLEREQAHEAVYELLDQRADADSRSAPESDPLGRLDET